MDYGREVVKEFAKRTIKNLEAIEQMQKQGNEVYEVTQLINSCLGLLVFPKERYIDRIPTTPLDVLEREGWPVPEVIGPFGQVANLQQLIQYLRNSITHFNITFEIGAAGETAGLIYGLCVWNTWQGWVTWKVRLTIEDLKRLVYKFAEHVINSYE